MNEVSKIINQKIKLVSEYNLSYEGNNVNLINELKKLPRSGIHFRLKNAGIKLPSRSVYDHMISLGKTSDEFISYFNLDIDAVKLANIIVFHDLAEAIIGDTPFFTSKELAKNSYKSKEEKEHSEKIVNQFILKNFKGELKNEFREYLNSEEQKDSTKITFDYFDRLYPILNIWRYINIFRNQIIIDNFLEAMNDFFINPHIINYTLSSSTKDIMIFLQNIDNARKFFYNQFDNIDGFDYLKTVNLDMLSNLILNKNMHYI